MLVYGAADGAARPVNGVVPRSPPLGRALGIADVWIEKSSLFAEDVGEQRALGAEFALVDGMVLVAADGGDDAILGLHLDAATDAAIATD